MEGGGGWQNAEDEELQKKANSISENAPDVLYHGDFLSKIPDKIVYQRGSDEEFSDESKNKTNKEWQENLQNLLNSYMEASKAKEDSDFRKNFVDRKAQDKGEVENAVSKLAGHLDKKITKKWKDILPSNSTIKEIVLRREVHEEGNLVEFVMRIKARITLSSNLQNGQRVAGGLFLHVLHRIPEAWEQECRVSLG